MVWDQNILMMWVVLSLTRDGKSVYMEINYSRVRDPEKAKEKQCYISNETLNLK